MSEPFKAVPAVFAILIQDGNVLFGRRQNTEHMSGKFGFPSGHVDGGEPLLEALRREVDEEIGVSFDNDDAELKHVMHRISSTDGSERLDFFFVISKWQGEPTIMEPDKCSELSWQPKDNLSEDVIYYLKEVLDYVDRDILYSSRNFE